MKSKKKTTTTVAGATPGIKEILGPGHGSTESRPTNGKTIDVPGGVSGQGELMTVRHGQCRPSPTQPRQVFGRIEELAESIRALGVQERLLVRPRPPQFTLHEPDLLTKSDEWVVQDAVGRENRFYNETQARLFAGEGGFEAWYEIVDGERRWRAAGVAGLAEVPVVVREMSDEAVVDYQFISFGQKEGLNELEEGAAFRKAIETERHTVESLVKTTGKSRSHIFGRMALTKLQGPVLKAYQAGEINASLAGVVNQVRGQKQQAKFLERVKSEKLSVRDAQEAVKNDFTLDLKDARFDQGDGELFPAAGACKGCPKRSGNNREEFPESEFKSPDVCTDPTCFHKKMGLWRDGLLIQAEADGLQIVPEKPGLIFYSGDTFFFPHKYVKADDVCEDDKKRRTYRQLVGKKVTRWGCLDRNDKLHELYVMTEAYAALPEAGVKLAKSKEAEQGQLIKTEPTEAEKRKAELQERLDAARGVAMAEAVFEKAKAAKGVWAVVVELMSVRMDVDWRACLQGKPVQPLEKLDEGALRCAALEMLMAEDYSEGLNEEMVSEAAKLLKVDVKQVEEKAERAVLVKWKVPESRQYKVNAHDVITDADTFKVPGLDKFECSGEVKYGFHKGKWWAGYDASIKGTGDGCGGSSGPAHTTSQGFTNWHDCILCGLKDVLDGFERNGGSDSVSKRKEKCAAIVEEMIADVKAQRKALDVPAAKSAKPKTKAKGKGKKK